MPDKERAQGRGLSFMSGRGLEAGVVSMLLHKEALYLESTAPEDTQCELLSWCHSLAEVLVPLGQTRCDVAQMLLKH